MASQLQASRLIPAHIFEGLGCHDKQAKLEGSEIDLKAVSDFSDFRLPANL
jgi:hypothetical protein